MMICLRMTKTNILNVKLVYLDIYRNCKDPFCSPPFRTVKERETKPQIRVKW